MYYFIYETTNLIKQKAWNKGKETKKFLCPHCNKMIDIGNLKRWHLDKCRNFI